MTENRYGLDSSYFKSGLGRVVRDCGNYSPMEMYRELTQYVEVALQQEKAAWEKVFTARKIALDLIEKAASGADKTV